MRVTQKDIATMAGVSQATVSRVLGGDQRVEETIRTRVRAAMRERNYKPDVRARALRKQRTGLIGLVVKRPHGGLKDDPFFGALAGAIVEHFAGKPYHLCVDMASSASSHEALYDEMLRSRRVDGLILVESEMDDERVSRLQADRFPFVVIGRPSLEGVLSVDNDNAHAGEVATGHLREGGYGRIGFLGARAGVTVSDDRIEGFLQAGGDPSLVVHADFGAEAAREGAERLLARADRPDALVVLDDFMAMGVVAAARRRGLRIPQDLGLVAFNDSSLCTLLEGGLTSVSLDLPRLVATACDRLLAAVEGRDARGEARTIVPARLCARGSSGRPLEDRVVAERAAGVGDRCAFGCGGEGATLTLQQMAELEGARRARKEGDVRRGAGAMVELAGGAAE